MLNDEQRIRMLEIPQGLVDIVLDTDAYNEIDDQYAISYALKSRKIQVRALYAAPFFNERSLSPANGMERSYEEIERLLKLSGKTAGVFRGSNSYLTDENTPIFSDAANDLVIRAMQYSTENPLYIVAIGAITNVASALLINQEIADRIVVVWLGGHALEWPHNAEFNCMQDIAAARVVFNSGAPIVMLPCMGVVSSFATTGPELHYWLDNKNQLCDYLVKNTEEAADVYAKGKVWSRVIWDVATIGWLLNDKNKFELSKLINTPIPQYDHHWSFDSSRPLCRYVYHINRDALMNDLFSHIAE